MSYFPISQSKHCNIMMASICTDQYCIRPSTILGLGQWVEQCNLITAVIASGHQAKIIIWLIYIYIYIYSHWPLAPSIFQFAHLLLTTQWLAFVASSNSWRVKCALTGELNGKLGIAVHGRVWLLVGICISMCISDYIDILGITWKILRNWLVRK